MTDLGEPEIIRRLRRFAQIFKEGAEGKMGEIRAKQSQFRKGFQVGSGKGQGNRGQRSLRRVCPVREETPCGVTTNTAVPYQTKPILESCKLEVASVTWTGSPGLSTSHFKLPACETKPIPGGAGRDGVWGTGPVCTNKPNWGGRWYKQNQSAGGRGCNEGQSGDWRSREPIRGTRRAAGGRLCETKPIPVGPP